jgi:hypothetical protein
MEMTEVMIAQVILLSLILAILMGIVQSATVIFEADAYFKQQKLTEEEVQDFKKRTIMPKLWAPMYEAIIGEILLGLFLIPGIVDNDAWLILLIVIIFFLIVIVALTRFFYYSGRRNHS